MDKPIGEMGFTTPLLGIEHKLKGVKLVLAPGPYLGLWERWWADRPNERELWKEIYYPERLYELIAFIKTDEEVFTTLDSEL